ncbi:MAG: cobalamin biosynthesis protein CobD [Kurthia sp.]|nr:cobalamin biosynthesis protein CobD [Candidatus Kurthia equi]
MVYHLIACTIGLLLDRLLGDPPNFPHPVRWIGNGISYLTKKLNRGKHRCWKGVVLTVSIVGLTTASVVAISIICYQIHWVLYVAVQSLLIATGLAQKSLKQAAMDVYNPLINGDLQQARVKLSWIVGRDTETLDEHEITRGVVETVSENTSDGVTAPLFYAFLFGATGLWFYKAINTLDSMVGYKNERFQQFGTCSAKLDDIVNFIPSRLTGMLILIGTKNSYPRPFSERFKGWLQDAKKHPSPNSGYLEAATAYQMGIQLGGLNYYEGVASHRAEMGISHMKLQASHIKEATKQMTQATNYFWLLFILLGGVVFYVAKSWC